MRHLVWLLAFSAGSALFAQRVVVETTLGDIEMQLEPDKAPITVQNFLRYVRDGRFDGGTFHRTVLMDNQPANEIKIEVVQAGPRAGAGNFPPIALERTSVSGLRHVDGAVSMARSTADSATGGFFICIGNQPELDFGGKRNADGQGFAAFGRVTRGLDVVRKIQQSPHTEQRLTPPIEIRRITLQPK